MNNLERKVLEHVQKLLAKIDAPYPIFDAMEDETEAELEKRKTELRNEWSECGRLQRDASDWLETILEDE